MVFSVIFISGNIAALQGSNMAHGAGGGSIPGNRLLCSSESENAVCLRRQRQGYRALHNESNSGGLKTLHSHQKTDTGMVSVFSLKAQGFYHQMFL